MSAVGSPVQECPGKKEKEEAADPKREWIAFRVVNDATDKAFASVQLHCTLPGDVIEEHTTDGQGLASVKNIDAGSCEIDASWKGTRLEYAVVFVSSKEESPTTEESAAEGDNGAPEEGGGPFAILKLKEHKVQDDETLKKIAEDAGMTWQELADFNWGTQLPSEINKSLRKKVGCHKKTKDGKNYVFTGKDDPGIVFIPEDWSKGGFATKKQHLIKVSRPHIMSSVELQTVDLFGHKMGNVALELKSEEGWPDVALTTDGDGVGKKDKVLFGRYRVMVKDGGPAFYMKAMEIPNQPAEGGESFGILTEAILNTENRSDAITRVVIVTDEAKKAAMQRDRLTKAYRRDGTTKTLVGQGEETKTETHSSYNYCADNLAIAAGWRKEGDAYKIDAKKLVHDILAGWMKDHFPAIAGRGYYVLLMEPGTNTVRLMNKGGSVEDTFTMTIHPAGKIGAYAIFEDVAVNMFVDMSSNSYVVTDLDNPERIYGMEEVVSDDERERFIAAVNKHAGENPIVYFTPTAEQLGAVALHGGTGRLEDYGTKSDANDTIHGRNKAVLQNMKLLYDSYLTGYIDKVKKTHDEKELRKLGPPRSPFEMPMPYGGTPDQRRELYEEMSTNELRPWTAIANRLDDFAGRRTQGSPFLRIKPKFVVNKKFVEKLSKDLRLGVTDIAGVVPTEIEVELNIDIQFRDGVQVLTKSDASIKIPVKLDSVAEKLTKNKAKVEVAFKQSLTDKDKRSVSVKIESFAFEADTSGKRKMGFQIEPGVWVESEFNVATGDFMGGMSFKGKDLASHLRGKNAKLDKVADYLESFELQVAFGFTGLHEESVLAAITDGPGFFERRSLDELFDPDTKWSDLTYIEHGNLATLGWTGGLWDFRYDDRYESLHPASLKKSRYDLAPEEKLAIVHLGFYVYEDYHKFFKKMYAHHVIRHGKQVPGESFT